MYSNELGVLFPVFRTTSWEVFAFLGRLQSSLGRASREIMSTLRNGQGVRHQTLKLQFIKPWK